MAIKKGVFDLYVQDRQLPHKSDETPVRESHFFDDMGLNNLDSNKNHEKRSGSQTVHKRFTNSSSPSSESGVNASDTGVSPQENNGSQTVHKRFTNSSSLSSEVDVNASDTGVSSQGNNGSQTVHKRFTNSSSPSSESGVNASDTCESPQEDNGSQTVHKWFTNDSSISSESGANASDTCESSQEDNGSQTVHKRFTNSSQVSFSKLIGNQRKIITFIFRCIQLNDGLITRELTLDEISIMAGINKKSLKNTLFRLTSTGLIIRSDQKVGRGGWVKYRLHSVLMSDLIEL